MRLISLNTWGGKLFDPFVQFVKRYSTEVDIFCFQEVFDTTTKTTTTSSNFRIDSLKQLQKILKNFNVYYSPYMKGNNIDKFVNFDLRFGLATFTKKDLKVKENDEIFIYGNQLELPNKYIRNMSNKLQYSLINKNKEKYNLFNIHGHWYPSEKLDTPKRIKQSEKIKGFIDKKIGKKILCGDFNLMPETESMQMLEEEMINLIKVYNIQSTRVRKYQTHPPFQNFADYILVSKDVKVLDFKVLADEVSDHRAMFLEFN